MGTGTKHGTRPLGGQFIGTGAVRCSKYRLRGTGATQSPSVLPQRLHLHAFGYPRRPLHAHRHRLCSHPFRFHGLLDSVRDFGPLRAMAVSRPTDPFPISVALSVRSLPQECQMALGQRRIIVRNDGVVSRISRLLFYVSHFAHYDKTYGSLGAVIVFPFWFYISFYIIL